MLIATGQIGEGSDHSGNSAFIAERNAKTLQDVPPWFAEAVQKAIREYAEVVVWHKESNRVLRRYP